MALLDLVRAGSFKGADFLVVSASTAGGRKQVKHEFPNSDRQSIEDLGFMPKTFSLVVEITTDFDANGAVDVSYFDNKNKWFREKAESAMNKSVQGLIPIIRQNCDIPSEWYKLKFIDCRNDIEFNDNCKLIVKLQTPKKSREELFMQSLGDFPRAYSDPQLTEHYDDKQTVPNKALHLFWKFIIFPIFASIVGGYILFIMLQKPERRFLT